MIRADAVLTPPVPPGTVSLGERAVPFGGWAAVGRQWPLSNEAQSLSLWAATPGAALSSGTGPSHSCVPRCLLQSHL